MAECSLECRGEAECGGVVAHVDDIWPVRVAVYENQEILCCVGAKSQQQSPEMGAQASVEDEPRSIATTARVLPRLSSHQAASQTRGLLARDR